MMPTGTDDAVASAVRAIRAVPPQWPLAATVAVNPFLGQAGELLANAAARLARAAGVRLTMPRRWFADRIAAGEIGDADLAAALAASSAASFSLAELKAAATIDRRPAVPLPTIADLAAAASGTDWPGIVADRIGHWAAAYFDQGQALWAAPKGDAYAAWRMVASHDLTPEIAGLGGFAAAVVAAPETAELAIARAVAKLGLMPTAVESACHRLLAGLGGWAQLARGRLWQAELAGTTDATATALLAIRLVWEEALLRRYAPAIAERWAVVAAAHAEPVVAGVDDVIDAVLQEASERAAQRRLAVTLADGAAQRVTTDRPALQVAFCIDVRSEVFRRALESLDPAIVTLGFAGFFGIGVAHRRLASDVVEARLPVLLPPGMTSRAGSDDPAARAADGDARIKARAKRAWGRFKLAAISSFAFVEAGGPLYVGRLLRNALALGGEAATADPAPRFDPPLDAPTRLATAEAVLRAMSLTDGFAPLVLLAGHGASVVNNPHASALQCGACGGHSGEVNARLLAGLLNDAEVRAGLRRRGIDIPTDTRFAGALHDTTTDGVTIFADDVPTAIPVASLARAKAWLASAGRLARSERALRLPRAGSGGALARRARDWAEVRPEWALAGCHAFIAAPRARTAAADLRGRAFLQDYDWRRDADFGVLELILTAPVVVASWISLQYYGSTVAPAVFGAGNKLLHNVTGGIGVVEGNGGVLRAGLPWQSVHDGERLVHEPLRLSVLIEAPREAITAVLARHAGVRALFDNGWLHLFALDDAGRMAWRYRPGGWEPTDVAAERVRAAA
ncbi:MAG: DUF2309 domain-containing protein [Sphingomonadaceae bacterium]|nr:DUF2309 domain-containing protein [Sphingomonadaceae bacterium]